jgi:hypothetical protein
MTASTPERKALEAQVGALAGADYEITSPRNKLYNCIAWAVDDDEHWWQPGNFPSGYYWPEGVPNEVTLEAFEAAYKRVGYRTCADGELEDGYEKVVLYTKDGLPSHAAKQLPNGRWTSKCGKLEDIEHATPQSVGGADGYGEPVMYMRRRIRANRPTAQELNIL